jgi:excisionase family DNA binding protein
MGAEKPFGGLGERLLTVKDVAQFLQCSTRKVQRMIDAGELEAIRIGRLVRVRPEALQALIESK